MADVRSPVCRAQERFAQTEGQRQPRARLWEQTAWVIRATSEQCAGGECTGGAKSAQQSPHPTSPGMRWHSEALWDVDRRAAETRTGEAQNPGPGAAQQADGGDCDTRRRTWRTAARQCRLCEAAVQAGATVHFCPRCEKVSCARCRTAATRRGERLTCGPQPPEAGGPQQHQEPHQGEGADPAATAGVQAPPAPAQDAPMEAQAAEQQGGRLHMGPESADVPGTRRARIEKVVAVPAPPTMREIPRAEAARAHRIMVDAMAYANTEQLRCFRHPGE